MCGEFSQQKQAILRHQLCALQFNSIYNIHREIVVDLTGKGSQSHKTALPHLTSHAT